MNLPARFLNRKNRKIMNSKRLFRKVCKSCDLYVNQVINIINVRSIDKWLVHPEFSWMVVIVADNFRYWPKIIKTVRIDKEVYVVLAKYQF